MHAPIAVVFLTSALATSLTLAQTTATWGTYSAGCPGTGIGLGGMHIVPAAAATTWGSGNAIPFGWSPVKYQQVFLGSELKTAFTIAALWLRQPHTGTAAHGFTVDLDIQLGYTTRWQTTLSTTFAANWDAGAPVQVVPRAQIVFPDQSTPPPSNPAQFLVTIPCATTVDWVPAPGRNLLMEVTVHGNSVGGSIYGYPADNLGGTWALYGTPASATTGALRGFGVVLGMSEQTLTAVPQLYSTDTSQINNTFRVRVAQPAVSSFALLLGFSDTGWGGFALPFDLGPRGAPGCSLLAAPESVQFVLVNSAGYTFFEYGIPNNIYLLGTHFYNQAMVADATVNALGFVTTNGVVGLLGNQ
jgi:hypothetical protein